MTGSQAYFPVQWQRMRFCVWLLVRAFSKWALILPVVALCCSAAAAQQRVPPAVSQAGLSENISRTFHGKIPGSVRVVGLGDVTPLARESVDFNTALIAFLVRHHHFRRIILFHDDWLLRPLNGYLTGKMPFRAATLDSLLRLSLANTPWCSREFRDFTAWLKKYNLAHPGATVTLGGVGPDREIPPAFFLAAYVFPVDRRHGLALSEKWGTGIYNDTLALQDLAAWYDGVRKDPGRFQQHKTLLLQCGADLAHNAVIRRSSALQADPAAYIAFHMRTMTELILQNADVRTIVYGNNEYISRSSIGISGYTSASPGMLLHRSLEGRYFACLTDFSDSARLHLMDPRTRVFMPVDLRGSAQAAAMAREKYAFFLADEGEVLRQYLPRTVSAVMGHGKEILPDGGVVPADALFIFPRLTPATLLPGAE